MIFSSTITLLLILSTLIIMVLQQANPEFVVHEVMACCHHEIKLKCENLSFKIGIVQARYFVPGSESKYLESLVVDQSPRLDKQQKVTTLNEDDSDNDLPILDSPGTLQTISHPNYVSLWDMDVTFVHEIFHSQNKLINLNSPDWMRYAQRVDKFQRYPPPSPVPPGHNFTDDKLLEMPVYDKEFLDKHTIWTQPLFLLKYQSAANHSSSHNYWPNMQNDNSMDDGYFPHCLSYEALLKRGQLNTVKPLKNKTHFKWENVYRRRPSDSSDSESRRRKPTWHYTDLRSVFNQRCSGRSKCTVDLLRNKLRDQDLTRVCNKWPDGRIVVKYLCYDPSSSNVHSKCNEEMETAREGFIINPGYPQVYPGDVTCQWKLHVEQQRILLVLLDVSLRGQEKSKCRDELVVREHGTKVLNTCGDHKSAIAVLSFSSSLNVTFSPRSRLAFPKRGFLLYFRAIGCNEPSNLANAYIVSRNATHLSLHCHLGYLFPDILKNSRWLLCNSLDNSWISGVSSCQDIRSIMASNTTTINLWPVLDKETKASIITDYIVPVSIMLALFLFNGFILLWIRKKKARMEAKMGSAENQELEEINNTEEKAILGITTPEESTYTLSSDGTGNALIGPTIKKSWLPEDELSLTGPHENIVIRGNNHNAAKTTNGGLVYNAVPTNNTNGIQPYSSYGFPRTTAV